MHTRRHAASALLFCGVFVGLLTSLSFAADPVLNLVLPRGAQRGTELKITLYGQRLADALEIRFERSDLHFLGFEEQKADRVRARIRVDPDAAFGACLLQLRTASGTSGYQSFHIGALPSVEEREPNNEAKTAQAIDLNRTVHGVLQARDLDLYQISIDAPTRVACELEGVRLGDRVFDACLEWVDASGAVIKSVDDDARGRLDPVLVHHFDQAGTYLLRVRELTWSGDGSSRYLLHVGTFPRPAICLPLGAPAGSTVELEWIGNGAAFRQSLQVPSNAGSMWFVHPADERGVAPTPQRLAIAPHANHFEAARATHLPGSQLLALNGVLAQVGEADDWKLECAKNQTLVLGVLAREYGSPLDAVLEVLDSNGKWLAGNDDGRSPDSRLSYRCPSEGIYTLRIRDLLGRGGDDFAYRVQVGSETAAPSLELGVTRGRALPTPVVARGSRGAVVLDWRGQPSDAAAEVQSSNLPAGVSTQIPRLASGVDWLPIVFEATPEAALSSAALQFRYHLPLSAAHPSEAGQPIAFYQYVPLLRVENDQPYIVQVTHTLGLGVIEALPFALEMSEPLTPIVAGGPLAIEVTLSRQEGFDAPVRVELLRTPTGIAAQALRFEKSETKKSLQLEARTDAPPRRWPFVLIAEASLDGGVQRTSSALHYLEVAAPAAAIAVGRTRAEPGQETTLELQLKPPQALTAGTILELVDLPTGILASAKVAFELSGDQTLKVPLQLSADAPIGRHRNFKVRLATPHAGGYLEHRFSGGEIRIDAPLPARPSQDPAEAKPAPARGSVKNPKT